METHSEPDNSDYRVRWEMIFEILAMNRTEPFLSQMGLKLSNPATIREISREYIAILDQSDYQSENDVKYIQETFQRIAAALGEDTLETLYKWGVELFPFGPDIAWYWEIILTKLGGINGGDKFPNTPNLDQDKIINIMQAVQSNFEDEDNIEAELKDAEHLPRTDWDLKIYRRQGLGQTPLLTVLRAIKRYRLKQTWSALQKFLDEEEIQELLRWARENIRNIHIFPETLTLELPF